MIDLSKLTPEELNRLECLLMVLSRDIEAHIDISEEMSKAEDYSEHLRATFKSNAEWFRECYKMLYGKEYTKT